MKKDISEKTILKTTLKEARKSLHEARKQLRRFRKVASQKEIDEQEYLIRTLENKILKFEKDLQSVGIRVKSVKKRVLVTKK